MFGSIGGSEFVLIAILALLLFGPRKLPEIGRTVGKAMAELRNATRDFRVSLERDVKLEKPDPLAVEPRPSAAALPRAGVLPAVTPEPLAAGNRGDDQAPGDS